MDEPFTRRQLKREQEIMALPGNVLMKNRSVPMSLYKKLLHAADFALSHGWDGKEPKPEEGRT